MKNNPEMFICHSKIAFKCPYCDKEFNDNDYYIEKVYDAFDFKANIKCDCEEIFKLGINHIGKFTVTKHENNLNK